MSQTPLLYFPERCLGWFCPISAQERAQAYVLDTSDNIISSTRFHCQAFPHPEFPGQLFLLSHFSSGRVRVCLLFLPKQGHLKTSYLRRVALSSVCLRCTQRVCSLVNQKIPGQWFGPSQALVKVSSFLYGKPSTFHLFPSQKLIMTFQIWGCSLPPLTVSC